MLVFKIIFSFIISTTVTIVDKPVPSRAYASLPNTYLSIGESDSGETVFARKEIPLRTQFGPFEGDFRILNREQLLEYRNNKSNLPLLLLNEQSILDVSNDSKYPNSNSNYLVNANV